MKELAEGVFDVIDFAFPLRRRNLVDKKQKMSEMCSERKKLHISRTKNTKRTSCQHHNWGMVYKRQMAIVTYLCLAIGESEWAQFFRRGGVLENVQHVVKLADLAKRPAIDSMLATLLLQDRYAHAKLRGTRKVNSFTKSRDTLQDSSGRSLYNTQTHERRCDTADKQTRLTL